MEYISTRGNDSAAGFNEALLAGLARDGGLFLPETWPVLSRDEWAALRGESYNAVAAAIFARFMGDAIADDDLRGMIDDTYKGFRHKDIAPLVHLNDGDDIHLLELFHGPTIAFKDYAMQFLARAFDHAFMASGAKSRATILGATSGDTGSAALEAFRGRKAADIFILFPRGRVSPIQEAQMTSVIADGAFAVAVEGDFDACQDAVKALFLDTDFRESVGLTAVNSINWARLMPQIVYYATAALALGAPERAVAFSVPTGNFGNIFAGYAARQMGLPIARLICASNRNDILTRFFEDGAMERKPTAPSLSPSMDIQSSSNFERLLFEMHGRDGAATEKAMEDFAATGYFTVEAGLLAKAKEVFAAFRVDDTATLAEIKATHESCGVIVDPHSAVGLAAARAARAADIIPRDMPLVSLACAHPAKFPAAVEKAVGVTPPLPEHLADLMEREMRCLESGSDPAAIRDLILTHCR